MKKNTNFVDARARVLETAWTMIAEQRDAGITLVDVAKRAGVSRQTVYTNFGNRAGLLMAMVEHSDATSPEIAYLEAKRPGVTAEQLFVIIVRGWFAYLPVVFKVARALTAAGESDVGARNAVESRWQVLRDGFMVATRKLQRAGNLAPGWTPETAADWLYHLTHVDTWQHLVIERGWSPDRVIEQTLECACRTLYADLQPKPTVKKKATTKTKK